MLVNGPYCSGELVFHYCNILEILNHPGTLTMESGEELSSTEDFSPEEVKVTVKTLLMQSIAMNNLEGFTMAIE